MTNTAIAEHMTPFPHGIHSAMPLKTARERMKKYGVRHLPVQLAGHLVGVVTDRDLKLGASFERDGELLVDDIMTPDPYGVSPDTPLREVIEALIERKYGCAVVLEKQKVVGIFTVTDALRVLAHELSKPGARGPERRP